MKKTNLLLLLSLTALFVVSCSDSGPSDNEIAQLTTGSYWIMDSYELNGDGSIDEDSRTIDSNYIGIPETINGTKYFPYITSSTWNPNSLDTTFYRTDKNKIYTLLNLNGIELLDVDVSSNPLLWANWDAEATWIAMDIDTSLSMDGSAFGMGDISIDAEVQVKIAPGPISKYSMGNEEINVKEFTVTTDTDISAMGLMTMKNKTTEHYFISKDKFIMQITTDQSISKIMIVMQETNDTTAASVSKVIRYQIK